jgi:hypothetical protein
MSAKIIEFDFMLPQSWYEMNKRGESVLALSQLTGYPVRFISKCIQREAARESAKLCKKNEEIG